MCVCVCMCPRQCKGQILCVRHCGKERERLFVRETLCKREGMLHKILKGKAVYWTKMCKRESMRM